MPKQTRKAVQQKKTSVWFIGASDRLLLRWSLHVRCGGGLLASCRCIAICLSRKRQADEISSTLHEKWPKTRPLTTDDIPVIIKAVVKALPNSPIGKESDTTGPTCQI